MDSTVSAIITHVRKKRHRDREKENAAKRRRYKLHRDKVEAENKRWRDKHRNELKAYKARNYKTNREKIKARSKIWYETHPEKAKASRKRWRELHPEKQKAGIKRWQEKNPERKLAHEEARRARKRGSHGQYTTEQISALYDQQRGHCANLACRSKLRKDLKGAHRDHCVPLSKGGTNYIENIQLLCAPCNMRKHTKSPEVWAQENGLLF